MEVIGYFSRIARRITATLFVAQSLGSAGLIAAAAINSIVGAELTGQRAWAGVPSAVNLLGAALSAFAWGYAMDRIGRRGSLVLGLLLGVVGAGLAGGAVVGRSFLVLLAGLALMGVASAALNLGRFAAAEVHRPAERGRAISYVVIGGTLGAVFGPLMIGPTGQWAVQAGLDELVGPYAAGLVLLALASVVIFLWLRPDPRDVGRRIARLYPETVLHQGPTRSVAQILREPAAMVATTAMVVGQMVMVMLMVITAVHMKDHQHSLTSVSLVFSSHTLGMYAFSILSGQLADRWGRGPVIIVGAGTMAIASLLAPVSPRVLSLAVALFLLGLGWNFCYVGGSSLLADQLSPAERSRTQGFNDMLIGLASAIGSFGSGLVFAALGYGSMGVAGAVASLLPLGLAGWWQMGRRDVETVR